MQNKHPNHVKILFRYFSDILEEEKVETMWTLPVDANKGLYKLDNIPFYGPLVAPGDIIYAEFDENEQMLTYRHTEESCGSSVVQVVLMDKTADTNHIRDIFNTMGCPSEKFAEGYFAMEIPSKVDYRPVKQKLNQLKEEGAIDYGEPCLSDNHWYH
jgi:hypothetical protein